MSSPLTGTFDDVQGHNRALVRKMLKMAVFLGDADTVDPIDSIVDDDNELVIPVGMESVGIMSAEQGASITPALETAEVAGYGYGQPIRRDIVSRNSTLGCTMLESKRRVFEAYYGMDLSAIKAPFGTKNEIKFDQADLPETKYWRVLCLGRDGQGSKAIYHAEHFLLMSLSDIGERSWSPTDPMGWPITLSADTDGDAGTPQRSFWAGPGLTTAKLTAMGFTRATA